MIHIWRFAMNRSALNAEVEYRLRMQEMERKSRAYVEPGPRRPGLLARFFASLKRNRGERREAPAGQVKRRQAASALD
jgi:hypothetical protein